MVWLDEKGHLISDISLSELHIFANKLGLKRSWFQSKTKYAHYDLTTQGMRNKAISCGVWQCTSKELVQKLKAANMYNAL